MSRILILLHYPKECLQSQFWPALHTPYVYVVYPLLGLLFVTHFLWIIHSHCCSHCTFNACQRNNVLLLCAPMIWKLLFSSKDVVRIVYGEIHCDFQNVYWCAVMGHYCTLTVAVESGVVGGRPNEFGFEKLWNVENEGSDHNGHHITMNKIQQE